MSLVGTEILGASFNEFYKGTRFYKFLNGDLIHYGFKYKQGLNIDIVKFNPTDQSLGGGLYFCEESKNHMHWIFPRRKISIIEIPDDARVYIECDKFKADKLILTEIYDFEDIPTSMWLNILPTNGIMLLYVKEQTEELCTSAVKQNGLALEYVQDQFKTEQICLLAVEEDSRALKYVHDQFKTKIRKLSTHFGIGPAEQKKQIDLTIKHKKNQLHTHTRYQNNQLITGSDLVTEYYLPDVYQIAF